MHCVPFIVTGRKNEDVMYGTSADRDTVAQVSKPRSRKFDPTWRLCLAYITRRTCNSLFILTIICKTLRNLQFTLLSIKNGTQCELKILMIHLELLLPALKCMHSTWSLYGFLMGFCAFYSNKAIIVLCRIFG